ncbi:MAG: alkaline phosphatase family protein [Phycisphaerae bacterium]
MKHPVIIFGLDGASFSVLDDLVKRGVMPFFGEAFARGARAPLMSTVPPLTPPAWITLVTGRTPGHHGIFNFVQKESPDSRFVRMISSREIACESLWSIVNRHGRRAGCLNFVAHNPAPRIDGYVIPGWLGWRWVKKQSHPADLIERLKNDVPGFDVKELAMNFSEEEKAIAGAFNEEYEPWIDLHIRRELQWFNILRRQLRHDPTELTAVVFDGVDKLQHLCWRFLDPACEPEQPDEAFLRVQRKCHEYFRQLDGFLRDTVELAGPDANILICSDHGFTGSTEVLYVNTWLEQQGYLTWNEDVPYESDKSEELQAPKPFQRREYDLSRTRAYSAFASTNGICINVRGRGGDGGIPPEGYEAFRRELIDALLTRCIDPESGAPIIRRVWTREEAFPGPKNGVAADLTLALRDHGNVSVLRSRAFLKPRADVLGCHHPAGVFMALGPGVRAGETLEPIHLVDIAPTVLYAMRLPIPADLEGGVATGAFTNDFLQANAVLRGAETHKVATAESAAAGVDAADEEDDPQVLMRLKALGYIE